MMKHIFIISSNFYDISSNSFTIGGIQTYIKDLCSAINNSGNKSTLVQFGQYKENQVLSTDFGDIILYPWRKGIFTTDNQRTFDCFYKEHDSPDSSFIIDTDQRDIKSGHNNVIQIQHGITFDIPGNMISGFWGKTTALQRINKQLRCWRNVARLSHVKNTVCVDYNYYNWFRTQDTIPDENKVRVIPNYSGSFLSESELEAKLGSNNHKIKIVFARRFVDYRGTRLMIEATKRLLDVYDDIEVTFAGGGPLLSEIEDTFGDCSRVKVTSYNSNESVSFHSQYDIAVIPTIFSEGTSLSLCEAMAAGCIPIASCVGGMSNILLDGYNGFLIQPNVNDLEHALLSIIEMSPRQRSTIAKRAYETAITSFSRSRWENQWLEFLNLNE